MSTTENQLWDIAFNSIENESLILIIGPEISVMNSDKSLNELLKERLDNSAAGAFNFYSDDEFFHFCDDELEMELAREEIRKFYDEIQPNEIHTLISEIPFHLIISFSPDLILKKLFENKKFDLTFGYYNKKQNPQSLEKPTSKKPLLYNIFGNIEKDESVVLTYSELFEYIVSIVGKDDLPLEIKSQLLTAKMILFIGFKFEKWYSKLLLYLLKIQNVKNIRPASIKERMMLPQITNFYSQEFRIKFLDYSSSEIINNIYSRFKEKNKLRSPEAKAEIFISYAWGGQSEVITNTICSLLRDKGFNVVRDKDKLRYLGDIRKFMDTIGKGKYVVVVISDKYLKSKNCMYEMLQIKNNDSIFSRIFPIVLEDAKIYDDMYRIQCLNYWDDQITEMNEAVKSIRNQEGTENIHEELDRLGDIRRILDNITDLLSNMNTLSPEIHNNTHFEALTDALDERIKSEN